MSGPRYKAWRFMSGRVDASGRDAGLRISTRGGIETVEGDASVRQSILMLLATRPGERVMRPRYGCHLHRLVFAPNDDTTAGLAIHYVRQAIQRWEPRVDVVRLDATRSTSGTDGRTSEAGVLEISLEYRVRATLQTERLVYAFDLAGERG